MVKGRKHTINFYFSAVDDLLRHPSDAPSVGLLLCKTQDAVTVKYALWNTATPIGVDGFRVTDALPEALANCLPSIQQIEPEMRMNSGPISGFG